MKVKIFTEGGSDKGFGHITRCDSLRQAFVHNCEEIDFIVDGDDMSVANMGYSVFTYENNWLSDYSIAEKHFSENPDVIIIDSYTAMEDFYQKAKDHSKLLLCIDDYDRLVYPKGSVILNGGVSAYETYNFYDHYNYIMGTYYIPLRRDFWKRETFPIKENIEEILIVMSGIDFSSLILHILENLVIRFGFKINVILSDCFLDSLGQIKKHIGEHHNVDYYATLFPKHLKELMLQSDLCICGGGQILYELASIGVPAIGVELADNQKHNLQGFETVGFIKNAGFHKDGETVKRIIDYVEYFSSKKNREESSEMGRFLVDGQGAKRVYNKIESMLNG